MLVLCLAFLVTLSDQVTKYLVKSNQHHLLSEPVPIVAGIFFDLKYVQNTGAAWGVLQGFNSLLIILSVVMLIVIVVFRRHFITHEWLDRIAMGLMIGGIAGNLIDRLRVGYVIDFLDFYISSFAPHFPAFNVADSAICSGVGLYILSQIFTDKMGKQTA